MTLLSLSPARADSPAPLTAVAGPISAPVILAQAATATPSATGKAGDGGYTPYSGQAGKDVVWVPTPQALVDGMLDAAGMTRDDYVIDLGSGDGRTVITAAKRGARARGIEYNPDMVALARRNAASEGMGDKVRFDQGDIFESDFSEATVLTLFLLPQLNLRLRPTILDMKPGTRVVSNAFDMGEWTPDQTITIEGECTSWCRAYKWIVPAKVDGDWQLGDGKLQLKQKFQFVEGGLTQGGQFQAISEGRLKGNQLDFVVNGRHYTGQVNGATVTSQGDGPAWTARRVGG